MSNGGDRVLCASSSVVKGKRAYQEDQVELRIDFFSMYSSSSSLYSRIN